MESFKLQDYEDGYILKNSDQTYTVVTSKGEGTGKNITEAIKALKPAQESKSEPTKK